MDFYLLTGDQAGRKYPGSDPAGGRKERFRAPEENWISVCPEWVCKALSPNSLRIDRVKKMPLYCRYGVQHFRLIDPVAKTLEVF